MMFRIVIFLCLVSNIAIADDKSCNSLMREVQRLEWQISSLEDVIRRQEIRVFESNVVDTTQNEYSEIFDRLASNMSKLEKVDYILTIRRGQYIQGCKSGFNQQTYPGPRKQRVRNIG